MENPFKYGEEVTGEYFCNRRDEIQRLISYMQSSNKVLLYSPRRWGKTSLIKEALSRLPQKKYAVIYCDLYPVLKEEHFCQILAQSFAKSFDSPFEKVLRTLRSLLSSFVPKVAMDPVGNVNFEFGFDSSKKSTVLAEELLDAISKYVLNQKKKGVVVFDEIQQIGELSDDRLERSLRSKIQSHHHISYLFVGSKRHLLMEMFSNPSRPFFKSAIHFPLNPIPSSELKTFMADKFEESGFKIPKLIISDMLAFTEGHPYYTQQLCFHIWETVKKCRRNIDNSLVLSTIENIVSIENASYQNIWGLLTRNQKMALKALASLKEGETAFSASFLQRVGIASADGLRKSLESLVTKELVEKENGSYKIQDVFFKRWLITRYISP